MSDKPSDIILTITVSPLANGKRKVLVGGAPEKEMPVVRAGAFAELHDLIDQVWIALMKREPQVVTVKEPRNAKTANEAKSAKADGEEDQETGSAGAGESDPLVAETATVETPEAEPHVIEHDWAVGELPGPGLAEEAHE